MEQDFSQRSVDAVECLFYNNSANPRAVICRELCSIRV